MPPRRRYWPRLKRREAGRRCGLRHSTRRWFASALFGLIGRRRAEVRCARKKDDMPTKDPHSKELREHVLFLLDGGGAHARFNDAAKDMPDKLRAVKPDGLPHSAWMLLEHARIAQWDILEFCRNPKHVSPDWPSGCWPEKASPVSAAAWDKSVRRFAEDTEAMRRLVTDPKTDLFAPIPHGS